MKKMLIFTYNQRNENENMNYHKNWHIEQLVTCRIEKILSYTVGGNKLLQHF